MSHIRAFLIFSVIFMFMNLSSAWAERYHGRFTFGSYLAKETFQEATAGVFSNDFNILSSRYYLQVSEIGKSKYTFITDLRDKHDFFNKLDKEKLELTADNQLQVRQLYLHFPNTYNKLFYKLGRFPVKESGAVHVDGGQIGWRALPHTYFTLFAGLNPKNEEEGNLDFKSKAQNMGISSVYSKKNRNFGGYYYLANSLVQQTYDGEVDRQFLFNNTVLQFNKKSRLTNLLYLDFVPSFKIQNLWLNYWRQSSDTSSWSLSAMRVDVIEYRRRRGIRETLPESIYEQASFRYKSRGKGKTTVFKVSNGTRQADGLSKIKGELGWIYSQFLKRRMNGQFSLGYVKNFASNDIFTKIGVGYFSKKWEFSFDQEIIMEDRNGVSDLPTISELVASYTASRKFFTTFSFQYARDNNVNIMSTFLKFTYRFGDKELAPIRDGAPPMGKL